MKQLILRNMTASDYFLNIFYRVRFRIVNKLFSWRLRPGSAPIKKNWELTFEDEFHKESWNDKGTKNWRVPKHPWEAFHPDHPHQYYCAPEIVKGTSCARFVAMYDPKGFPDDRRTGSPITIPFRVSKLTTKQTFRQQYGRFEIRCNVPFIKGAWPAFWLWGSPWPPEIDIFELYGKEDGKSAGVQEINLHWGHNENGKIFSLRAWKVPFDKGNVVHKHHEFAMEWTPKKISIYCDGFKVFRFTDREVLNEWFNPIDTEMWMVINNAIDIAYVKPDEKNYYSEFLVDYIRAYKKK